MRLLITGSPGTGKTTLAEKLSRVTKHRCINELEFSLANKLGRWDAKENELVVPLTKLKNALIKEIKGVNDVILEGHLLCEIKLPVDAIILLRVDPEILNERLERKKYSMTKIADNVFCEGIDYCKKQLMRKYQKERIIEIKNESNIKNTLDEVLKELKRRGIYEA
ncbi:MAG: AAA family ATPase [Candidatus Diapherotrites archaeon]|nr:AAA family ATPase [Candidatus Diapherotrites archaeon]